MTETVQGSGSAGTGKKAVTLGILGFLCVVGAFSILYRAERTGNRRWIASRAEPIDPNAPGNAARMVRFTGMPGGELVVDADTGTRFVLLSRSRYEFGRDKASAAGDGWSYAGGDSERARGLRVGAVRIRLEEAEIVGRNAWSSTILRPDRGAGAAPRAGDVKIQVSGIPEGTPLFCVGRYADGYLGAGKLFIVSSYSEGKTMEELREAWVWRWIRHPLCFLLLLAGFVLIGFPAKGYLGSLPEDSPARPLARIGWPAYLALSLALSFVLVRFSSFTADLLWVIIILVVVIPVLMMALKRRPGKGA